MTVSTSRSDGDGGIAGDLYPVALQQARFEALISSAVWLAFGALWFVSVRSGVLNLCGVSILAGGCTPTIRAIRWWRWLTHATPEEALPRLLG